MSTLDNTPVGEKPKKANELPKPGDQADKPVTPSAADTANALSTQATTPGDRGALATAKAKESDASQLLGKVELVTDKAATKPAMSQDAVREASKKIDEAAFNRAAWGWGWSKPQPETIRNIIEPMSAADRKRVEDDYRATHKGHNLRDDLKAQLGADSPEYLKLESILNRKDGKSDEAGQVRLALNKLDTAAASLDSRSGIIRGALDLVNPITNTVDKYNDLQDMAARRSAESDIRKSIGTLTAEQIKEFKETYANNYKDANGRPIDIEQRLLSDPAMSQTSKEALKILFKGIDHRTGSDPESVKNALALADLGLKTGNIEIFKDAMQSASPETRKAFVSSGGLQKIDKTFGSDDRDTAHSYADQGAGSLAMLIEGSSHWYHTNKESITQMVTSQATDLDRQRYTRGKELADKNTTASTPEDKVAADFYKRVHDGLSSAGSKLEVQKWEAQLMKSESVVSSVIDARNEGGWFGWGANTDRNKLYSSVENLSKDDWQKMRANPTAELAKVQKALDTFADPKDASAVMQMLRDKVVGSKEHPINSYEDSQQVGKRSIEQTFADNKTNPAARLDRIGKMTDAEIDAYRTNKDGFKDRLNQLLDKEARAPLENLGAKRLIQELVDGKKPDKVDLAIMLAYKGDDPAGTARAVEAALKENPALIKPGAKSPEDSQTLSLLRGALNKGVADAGFGDRHVGRGGYIRGRQDEFSDQIFKTGQMPIQLKIELDKDDKMARYRDIAAASPEERARLLNPAPDEATKRFQDKVLGSAEDKEVLQYALKQGKLTDADVFRAFVNGAQTRPEDLKDMLNTMTPDQRQDLANEYFTKYHTLISKDVIDKVPDQEKFRFREMLAPTETNVRQVVLDTREERDKHTSVMDPVMDKIWDKSRISADEAQASMEKFVKDHHNEIDKLTPEQRKQFFDSVDNYQKALKNYIDSKGQMAEVFVDAAITVAAVGGSLFTGGTSLALLATIGASGAAFRVAAMKGIQGTDFDASAGNVAKQAFKGFVAADLGFIGPQHFGLNGLFKVGDTMALKTAESVVAKLGAEGLAATAFKGGTHAAESVITKELAAISKQALVAGGKETEAVVQKMATAVLKDSATPAERALVERQITAQVDALRKEVVANIRQKVLLEADRLATNVSAAVIGNTGSEVLATAVGLEDPSTLWDRVKSGATSAAGGVVVFHFGFKAAGAAYHGAAETYKGARAALGMDNGKLFAAEGTFVRHADGTTTEVKKGEKLYLQKTDKIVSNLDNVKPKAPADGINPVDGRPLNSGRTEFIKEKFSPLNEADRIQARENVIHDLKEVKASATASGADGKALSVHEKLMADPNLSDAQKQRVVDLLADVREHYASYRTPDGKMLADQEVNWIHTQGELAKVLESAQANKLSALETENALIASMFSDAAKFTDTALTKGNFTTHHLDGALAAAEALERRGFPPERIASITQAIREHQIAPPEFMGFIYQTTIARNLKAQLDNGTIDQAKYDSMKKVLDDMTVVTGNMPRIKQIADVNNAPLVKDAKGNWEVAFTPEQRELMKLAGTEHWYVPHDPQFLADGKTLDPDFAKLPAAQQAEKISAYKSSRALIDGDGIDNYATMGGASKIVKIRGPETFFPDKTVWQSVDSIDASFNDANKVLTPEGQRLAAESLAARNRILNDKDTGIRAQMDNWLKSQGKDPADTAYYSKDLSYPKPLDAAEQGRLKELQGKQAASPAEKAEIDAEIRALKYKGLTEQQISDFEFAKKIRDQMTDFMRMAQRTDGSLPGNFERSQAAATAELAQANALRSSDVQDGVYKPRIAAPNEAELAALQKRVPDLGPEAAQDYSNRMNRLRDSWKEDLTPQIKHAAELAPKVDSAYKVLESELAKVTNTASAADIAAAKLDPNHPLNKQANIHESYKQWKTVADQNAALNMHIVEVTNARAQQLQSELDEFTSKHGLAPVTVKLSENMHAAGGYTFGEGVVTLPRTSFSEAGGALDLNKVAFHELTHALGQDKLLVLDAMRKAAQSGTPGDTAAIKANYKEATGRDLSDNWLASVSKANEGKPALSQGEITRAAELAKSVKESVTDVGRKSEELGNTARVIDSKIKDLSNNIDGQAVDRMFKSIIENAANGKLDSRLFGTAPPSPELTAAIRDWHLAQEGKLGKAFDAEAARQLMLKHLQGELSRVNQAHADLINQYGSNQIEREAYGLSSQVSEPASTAERARSSEAPTAIHNENPSNSVELAAKTDAPINDALKVALIGNEGMPVRTTKFMEGDTITYKPDPKQTKGDAVEAEYIRLVPGTQDFPAGVMVSLEGGATRAKPAQMPDQDDLIKIPPLQLMRDADGNVYQIKNGKAEFKPDLAVIPQDSITGIAARDKVPVRIQPIEELSVRMREADSHIPRHGEAVNKDELLAMMAAAPEVHYSREQLLALNKQQGSFRSAFNPEGGNQNCMDTVASVARTMESGRVVSADKLGDMTAADGTRIGTNTRKYAEDFESAKREQVDWLAKAANIKNPNESSISADKVTPEFAKNSAVKDFAVVVHIPESRALGADGIEGGHVFFAHFNPDGSVMYYDPQSGVRWNPESISRLGSDAQFYPLVPR